MCQKLQASNHKLMTPTTIYIFHFDAYTLQLKHLSIFQEFYKSMRKYFELNPSPSPQLPPSLCQTLTTTRRSRHSSNMQLTQFAIRLSTHLNCANKCTQIRILIKPSARPFSCCCRQETGRERRRRRRKKYEKEGRASQPAICLLHVPHVGAVWRGT